MSVAAASPLRPVRNTSLIEIRVFSENAEEAAQLANKIAESYAEYRLEQRKRFGQQGIKSLEDRFHEYEEKVKETQKHQRKGTP